MEKEGLPEKLDAQAGVDEDPSGANRRRHERYDLSILVQFRFETFEDFLAEYVTNLSVGGMFIRTKAPKNVGTLVYPQFYLHGGQKFIEGLGRVVRIIPPTTHPESAGMGVEFVNMDPDSMALIEEVCAARENKTRALE